ncbi:ABC transporter substrate-binding protein [Mycolicibacterium smegmatis]|uniref:ABC transporter, periplasmic substrate-binding protein, putative n=3 Tax=Mycolicibacterium smegmatis TaxID=1772 RepID=A0R6T8_MYCS2|nr:extracellular solute-binding protein [Mycolicibacterium smegmatis]ABK74489.1 ABC transporter, periplasmic substrate-binding protein, putative [Mycolicibacterium smegmatis MC2 155]AIU11637.1 ABC transporter substrate-binding protein [Mycolicibacterium smegmatis MC2 155]AIU18262.1 ABC transporter substrate-binding protein [Mycolicibacterium smegmatis]AIU24884.1 ABC transporter substrate-binding protein [Mycolicibacterium smegmatis]MBE9620807.1 extracellular solute-binding protein [Mycolicibac
MRQQKWSRWLIPAMLTAISLPLAACGGSAGSAAVDASSPPDINAAKEQAEQFRTAGMPDDWINFGEFYQSVCDTYQLGCNGFAVQGVNRVDTDMSSAEEIAAFKNETTNAPMCSDIGIAFGQVAETEGVLLNYTPKSAADLPAAYKAHDGGWVATAVGVISIMTNTDVVPNPPRSFADLLKPEYKGKVSISNPVTSGTGQATVFSTAAALSKNKGQFDLDAAMDYWAEFYKRGQRNEAEFSAASFERGETPIRLAYDFVNIQAANLVKDKGIHTENVIPAEGGVWQPSATMCNKKTEDPDLAKLVLDHTLSKEGQLTFAKVGARPVLYTLGKLDVPAELKANWLPESQYVNVIQYPDDSWPDPSVVADRWENDVLTAGG